MTTRRTLMLAVPALALARCGNTPTPNPPVVPPSPSNWATAATITRALANGLSTALTYLPLTPTTVARYQGYIKDLADAATALLSVQDQATGTSIVHRAILSAQTLISELQSQTAINLPIVVRTLLIAANVALGSLEGIIGLVSTRRGAPAMPLDRALQVLNTTPPAARAGARHRY